MITRYPFLLIALALQPLVAQQDGSRVFGRITDPSGKAVPAATVKLIGTGEWREVRTTAEGFFAFFQVPVGVYRLQAEASGFARVQSEEIRVEVQTPAWLDLRLPLGERREAIHVTDSLSVLNRVDATHGNALGSRQITQLPLEGRNVAALLSLQPGVVYTSDTNVVTRTNFGEADADARNGSVNGGRSDQANVTLDGVDVNDQQSGFAFTSVLRAGAEWIQEFRVVTSTPNADQGRSGGAQVSLVTRSGSNEFHGSLFHAHRNTATTANSFFNNRARLPRARLIRNTFGPAVGGPVLRNKLFFFGAYEGRRDASETGVFRNVPTADLRRGIVKYRARNGEVVSLTPQQLTQLDPLRLGPNRPSLDLLNVYPLPNDSPSIDPLNFGGFRFNSPTPVGLNAGTVRLDAPWNGRHSLFLRANVQTDRGDDVQRFPGQGPEFVNRNTSKGLALGHNATLGSNLVHSFRYGYTRAVIEEVGASTAPAYSFGAGIGAPIPFSRSRGRKVPVHNFVEDVSWTRGRHLFSAGGNIRLISNNRYNVAPNTVLLVSQQSRLANRGTELAPADILPGNINDFVRAAIAVLGVVSQGNAPYNYDRKGNRIPWGEPLRRSFRTNEFEFFAQDTWRLRPSLTLTYGLRYSLYSPVSEADGTQVAPTIPLGNWFEQRRRNGAAGIPSNASPPLAFDLAGPGTGRPGFYDWDRNNLAPRVSLAWALDSKTTVRGGFSLLYDRIGSASVPLYDSLGSFGLTSTLINSFGSVSLTTAPRFTGIGDIPPGLLPDPLPFRLPQTFPRGGEPGSFAIIPAPDSTLRTPYAANFSFSVQRQLPDDWLFEVSYVARRGYQQLSLFDVAMPLNLRDPLSGTTYFDAVNALVAQSQTPIGSIARSPYWENLFPGLAVTAGALSRAYSSFTRLNPGIAPDTPLSATQTAFFLFAQNSAEDYTTALLNVDQRCTPACSRFGPYAFFNDQFSSLFTWRSAAPSRYDSLQMTLRKRFSNSLQMDVNYTLSQSRDWASGAERGDAFSRQFMINSWQPAQLYAPSDFDLRHQFNANWVYSLPVGRKHRFGGNVSRVFDGLIGGWQVAGVWRMTSGFPVSVLNGVGYPTNYYLRGFARPLGTLPATTRNKNAAAGPNLFSDPNAARAAFGSPLAGESGVRNNLRGDGLFTVDVGLSKRFSMPWSEKHGLALRAEAFNLTNSVRFNVASLNLTTGLGGFGSYTGLLVQPRVVQFMLRYEF